MEPFLAAGAYAVRALLFILCFFLFRAEVFPMVSTITLIAWVGSTHFTPLWCFFEGSYHGSGLISDFTPHLEFLLSNPESGIPHPHKLACTQRSSLCRQIGGLFCPERQGQGPSVRSSPLLFEQNQGEVQQNALGKWGYSSHDCKTQRQSWSKYPTLPS